MCECRKRNVSCSSRRSVMVSPPISTVTGNSATSCSRNQSAGRSQAESTTSPIRMFFPCLAGPTLPQSRPGCIRLAAGPAPAETGAMKDKEQIVDNWLPRYTGVPLDGFGDYILLTNFGGYLGHFARLTGARITGED